MAFIYYRVGAVLKLSPNPGCCVLPPCAFRVAIIIKRKEIFSEIEKGNKQGEERRASRGEEGDTIRWRHASRGGYLSH